MPDQLPPVAVPARIDPGRFEGFEGFRETTLAVFTDPVTNAALRVVGELFYSLALEYVRYWPREPDGSFRHQCRAVLADLRHLEGWLGHLASERSASSLSEGEEQIALICGALLPELKAIGDTLEAEERRDSTDPSALPSLEKLFRLCDPLPWEEQRHVARDWLLTRWARGEGEGKGNVRLLHELRVRADDIGAFSCYHVVALEMLSMLRERGGDASLAALGASDLAKHLLATADVPPEAASHYASAFRKK